MSRSRIEIRIGLGSCCVASGSQQVYDALKRTVRAMGAKVEIRQAGCIGICHRVPLIEIVHPSGRRAMYGNVTPAAVPAILAQHVPAYNPLWLVRRAGQLVARDEAWQDPRQFAMDPASGGPAEFLDPQVRVATAQCGRMDPTAIDEYVAFGGYEALRKAVGSMTPEAAIDEVTQAGLRGRGGAGFPTGRKWRIVRDQPAGKKYVICNGDEGDPGAFMDRMLLEAYPHRIVEGLALAAFAVGADEAFFYVRQEYPLAVSRIANAIAQAAEAGLIVDPTRRAETAPTLLPLTIHIRQGSGAFVCGEETALIASIQGDRGTPRIRPPYPAESGLFGRPTLVNNVETLANVPAIIRDGADAFAAVGTDSSKGTKVFSLTGKVNRGGLIEVPMGTTIRTIVEKLGGGIKDGRRFAAVQIGGPSGGMIPAELADTPIDFEALAGLGAIMGSGGLVVLDDTDCIVDIARYFLQFTENESCGKCTFCRIGTKRMLEILNRIVNGQGKPADLDELESLARQVKTTSLCGLGQTAPNPVLTSLKYFRADYEAHLAGRCPAGRCNALIKYRVTDDCIGCTICAQVCPVDAIEARRHQRHFIDMSKCTCCHMCVPACPEKAIRVE